MNQFYPHTATDLPDLAGFEALAEQLHQQELAKQMSRLPCKEIAEAYVGELLAEKILKVTKDHIQIMDLVIPRERVVYFQVALSTVRMETKVAQSANGYTVEPVTIVNGNNTMAGYSINSNVEGEGKILLTRKLATELYEVVAFFIPKTLDKQPTDQED